jgi:hypothetical protein
MGGSAMDARWRVRVIAGAMVLAIAGVGCNPFNLAYFLTGGPESKVDPEFRLANKDYPVTVLILAYSTADVQTDQIGVDRQLGTMVARQLQDRCQVNREKVKVVPIHKVEKFKSDHPGWKSMGAAEIGRQFEADYVVDIELVRFGLYEPGSHRQLYRGNCKIDVAVLDVRKTQDGPVLKKSIGVEYPKSSGPQPAMDDNNIDRFRDKYVTRIASEICWLFTTHPFSEECQCD